MQTGSSGCQFSWLTIFLLVAMVLCYQQQILAINTNGMALAGVMVVRVNCSAVGIAGKTQPTTTTNSNVIDSDVTKTTTDTTDSHMLLRTEIVNYTKLSATTNNNNKAEANANSATDLYESYGLVQKLMSSKERSSGSTKNAKSTKAAATKTTTTTTTNTKLITKNTTKALVPTKIAVLTSVPSNNSNKSLSVLKTTIKTAITNTIKTGATKCSYYYTTNMPTRPTTASSHNMADMAAAVAVKVQVSQRRPNSGNIVNNNKYSAAKTKCTYFCSDNKNHNTIPPIIADNDDDRKNKNNNNGNNNNNNHNGNSYNYPSMQDNKRFSIR